MCSLPKMNNRDSIFDIWIPEPYKSIGQCCLAVAQFRLNIWHTLCCRRHIKMRELAEMYGVTTRTIRLDVEHLSLTYPIETVRGRYDGCVKIPDWYIPTTSPLNAIQMDFLVNLQKTMVGTDADMLRGIISALTPM